MAYGEHRPAMLEEVLGHLERAFSDSPSRWVADLTFGAGGHSLAVLERIRGSSVLAFDRDPEACRNAAGAAARLDGRLELRQGDFSGFPETAGGRRFAGILADLGVSSHQLDTPERGFSFRSDGPLDMRMDRGDPSLRTAAELLAEWDEARTERALAELGEEPFARRIARAVARAKGEGRPPRTTSELEGLVFRCYPRGLRRRRTHPATRTFQALRLAVNRELEALEGTLPRLPPLLAEGGVLAVLSFHSLEDRIVKRTFRRMAGDGLEILTKRPQRPGRGELVGNFRARSAKLRVMRRTCESAGRGA